MSCIVFRTDASTSIGTGHVMRCLTLAAKLKEGGAQVIFICRQHPGHLCDAIEDRWGYVVCRLPRDPTRAQDFRPSDDNLVHAEWLGADWEDDAAQTAAAMASQCKKADWLVADHYALDARWETALRSAARNIMVIDDLADRPHGCDVLLDQNLHHELTIRYDGLVPSRCQRLLGPRYALLRPEFRAERAKSRFRDGTLHRVLVFFGGNDASNQTAKTLHAINTIGRTDIAVDVIAGPTNPHMESIRALCAGLPRARLLHNPSNIAELMANADLAIGATGATTWERCCLGLPSIVISLAMNQESIAHAMAANGLAIYLGSREAVTADMIAAAIERLARDPDRMKVMGSTCAELTDGNGTERVARLLDSHALILRRTRIADCESLYQWRNAEETRRYSRSSDPIPLREHQEWLKRVLQDPDCVLLIGERDCQPIGVLRYDCESPHCTVSVYLVPGQHGRGYGSRLLQAGHAWLQLHRNDIRQVRAEVLAANRASIDAFLQAGYQRQNNVYIKNLG